MEINLSKFVTLCEDLDIVADPSYSGRGMYGRRCIGIIAKRPNDIAKFLLVLMPQIDPRFSINDGELDYSPDWENFSSDNVGRDIIYYWPTIQAVDVEDAQNTLI
jgi:hypothetical protein